MSDPAELWQLRIILLMYRAGVGMLQISMIFIWGGGDDKNRPFAAADKCPDYSNRFLNSSMEKGWCSAIKPITYNGEGCSISNQSVMSGKKIVSPDGCTIGSWFLCLLVENYEGLSLISVFPFPFNNNPLQCHNFNQCQK